MSKTGQRLWNKAKGIIPGGNMLLSKRAEMFLPDNWPTYFSKAKGVEIWDLDNIKYIDMSIFGVGTNTLGYGNKEVDSAVKRAISLGNMSTFNAPEEVYLAEKLINMHKWAEMARFCRTGGEANAVAIRIARAAAGRDKVAFCGYHGWHDWYLAANLKNSNSLDGHLLDGLEPNGVPKELTNSIIPFSYNSIDEFNKAISDPEVGVIFMEVARNSGPKKGFLEKIRQEADAKGIVLVFDECTSAFRQTYGGLHKEYGVNPDIATFGKTLGNGYAITAIIGKQNVMEAAQTSFISSSFWTERIGFVAAIKTLEIMNKVKSWEIITDRGLIMRKGWQSLASEFGLTIAHSGLAALCNFSFKSHNSLAYKTLITQEMLKKGYLAGTSFYASIIHSPELIEKFIEDLRPVFEIIASCEAGRPVAALLDGPIAHKGFERLN